MAATIRPLFAAAALTALLAACDDPNAIEAQAAVVADTVELFTVNDAPLNAPSAIDLFRGPVPVTSSYSFDLAVELSGTDRVLFIPNSRLAGGLVATHRVGLQRTGDAFDAVRTAPISGYKYDSVFVVRPGETVIVESANPAACAVPFYGTVIYAKFVVDSIKTAPGRVYLRTTVDPNCGFRSLVAGSTPKE